MGLTHARGCCTAVRVLAIPRSCPVHVPAVPSGDARRRQDYDGDRGQALCGVFGASGVVVMKKPLIGEAASLGRRRAAARLANADAEAS